MPNRSEVLLKMMVAQPVVKTPAQRQLKVRTTTKAHGPRKFLLKRGDFCFFSLAIEKVCLCAVCVLNIVMFRNMARVKRHVFQETWVDDDHTRQRIGYRDFY